MFEGRNVLAIVPARSGSKGILRKNLREVGGIQMVRRVRNVVTETTMIDRAVVSTDDPEIARAAGLPWLKRPEALCGDRVPAVDVLQHALKSVEREDGNRYEIVLYLEPTAPLRRRAHLEGVVQQLIAENRDAVWTLSAVDPSWHPQKLLTLDEGHLGFYDSAGTTVAARQELSPLYRRNGVAYAMTRACTLQHGFQGRNVGAYVMDDHYVSIDTETDLRFSEFILSNELVS